MSAMGFPAGELRVSDAERDRGVAQLSEHFQAGRITHDEFDDRCGRALRARTGRELSELFADLPGGCSHWPALSPQEMSPYPVAPPAAGWPERTPGRGRSGRMAFLGVFTVVIAVGLLRVVSHIAFGHGGLGWVIPVLVVLLVLRCIRRR